MIYFQNNKLKIENNLKITIDYDNLLYIKVNNELVMDRIYLATNAISFGGIENIIRHHSNNITEVVSIFENEKEIVYLKNGELHCTFGPSYIFKDKLVYSIDGEICIEEEFYKNEKVIIHTRELKLKRITKNVKNFKKNTKKNEM